MKTINGLPVICSHIRSVYLELDPDDIDTWGWYIQVGNLVHDEWVTLPLCSGTHDEVYYNEGGQLQLSKQQKLDEVPPLYDFTPYRKAEILDKPLHRKSEH